MFALLAAIILGVGFGELPYILCDTGSSDLHESKTDAAVYQLQQLINQESMLRLTLDRQIQETRTLVHKMHLKLDSLEKICQDQLPQKVDSLETALLSVERQFHNLTESLVDDEAAVKKDLNTGEIENKINRTYDALWRMIVQEISAVDRRVSENRMSISVIKALQTRPQRPAIFFSASVSSEFTTGSSNEVIVFDNVMTNEGGGYSASTGVFTCPLNGTYLLSYGFLSSQASRVHVKLAINDKDVMWAVAPEDQAYNSAERSFIFELAQGDEVKVRVNENGAKFYDAREGRYCTFSGLRVSD